MRRIAYSILAASLIPLAGCSGGGSSVASNTMTATNFVMNGFKSPNQPTQTTPETAATPPAGSAQLAGSSAPANGTAPVVAPPPAGNNPLSVMFGGANTPAANQPAGAAQSPLQAFGGTFNMNAGMSVGNGAAGMPNVPNQPNQSNKGKKPSGVKQPAPAQRVAPIVRPQPAKLNAPTNNPFAPSPARSPVPTVPPAGAPAGGTKVALAPARAGTAAAPASLKPPVAETAHTPPVAGQTAKVAPRTATASQTVKPAGKAAPIRPVHRVSHYLGQPKPQTLQGRPAGVNGVYGNQPDDGSAEMDFAQELLKSLTLGPKDENSLGQSVGVSLTNQYGTVDKDALKKYVSLVGLTVATSSQRPDIEYVFGVLDTPNINAFSGPNGYIFITRGALENMQDEAELAGVLAHEISHVVLEHGLQQVKQAAGNKALLDAVKIAGGPDKQMNQLADAAVTAITNAGYSQPQEFDADASAVVLMSAAGYNPASYLHFLQRIQSMQTAGSSVMSTHPGADQRVAKIIAQLAPNGTVPQTGATLADRFHANVKF